jgi:IS5 family transposase
MRASQSGGKSLPAVFERHAVFSHQAPIDSSSMNRWGTRLGQSGAELLLKETIQAGLKLQAIKSSDLSRVNVDTTFQ